MLIAKWNTGRMYGSQGQLIVARFTDEGSAIVFADLTRGIDGYLGDLPPRFTAGKFGHEIRSFAAFVMGRYDRGDYAANAQSHEFYGDHLSPPPDAATFPKIAF